MKEFTVSRKTWLRGEGSKDSSLFRPEDKKMCCLGFLGKELCGATEEQMAGSDTPGDSDPEINWIEGLLKNPGGYNSDAAHRLMDINDEECMDDEEREELLTKEFAKLGITVKFKD